MADPADDSSCAAGSCLDAEDHTAAQNIDDTEQQLRTELLDLREQHQLQQQEVVLLHAQVERLSMLQLERTSEEGHVSVSRDCCHPNCATEHHAFRRGPCRVLKPLHSSMLDGASTAQQCHNGTSLPAAPPTADTA